MEWLGHPAGLLVLALLVQFAGRMVALNGSVRVDSLIYALNAYQFYSPDATAADLVKDKPGGQAVLTGWVYRLSSAPPTRLALAPLESAFMLGAYAIIAAVVLRILNAGHSSKASTVGGTHKSVFVRAEHEGTDKDRLVGATRFSLATAAALTLFVVIAENVYNALDSTTDGFNLGENYLLLPVVGAVYAHLAIRGPIRRGLLRGVCIGLALSIKQTAVAVLVATALDGIVILVRRGVALSEAARDALATGAGIALGGLPLVVFLAARGWLGAQMHAVFAESGRHVGSRFSAIELRHLAPVLPLLWLVGVPAIAWLAHRWDARAKSPSDRTAGNLKTAKLIQPSVTRPTPSAALQFALIWLAIEVAMLASMVKPSTHYYQPVVPALALLAACGVRALRPLAIWKWIAVTMAGLAIIAALPLIGAYRVRGRIPDISYERQAFAGWLTRWPAAPDSQWMHAPAEGQR